MRIRHLLIVFTVMLCCELAAAVTCSDILRSDSLNVPETLLDQLSVSREDVILAIAQRNKKMVQTRNDLLPKNFARENLKPYFDKTHDPFSFVTLFRGLDDVLLDFQFSGEKNLIWTSLSFEDALTYALNTSPGERAFIIKMSVPKFMVFERSGWPVLRFEDVPDLRPFVEKVAAIPIGKTLFDTIEHAQGDDHRLINLVRRTNPSLFNEESRLWKTGREIDTLLSQ